jgi:hypothetical protein
MSVQCGEPAPEPTNQVLDLPGVLPNLVQDPRGGIPTDRHCFNSGSDRS